MIIDELDRCSPSYAVKLLETIKHYFNNDNIVFLISTDVESLSKTVKKFYGNDFDGEGYLDRFFDLRIDIPEFNKEEYVQYLNGKYEIRRPYRIPDYFNMSLREINRYVSLINAVSINNLYPNDKESEHKFEIICFAAALKVKNKSGYNDFNDFINGKIPSIFSEYVRAYHKNSIDQDEIIKCHNNLNQPGEYSELRERFEMLNIIDTNTKNNP